MSKTITVDDKQNSEKKSFDEILVSNSIAHDIGITVRNANIYVQTIDGEEKIGDIFDIAKSPKSLREYIEDEIGEVDNHGDIEDIQESLFNKQWTGDGFSITYHKTENGNYQLVIPYGNDDNYEHIVVDEFNSRNDKSKARKLIQGTDVELKDFYEVFSKKEFVFAKESDTYLIKRYEPTYEEEIAEKYTSAEYKYMKRRNNSTETSYSGWFLDDKPADMLTVFAGFTSSIGIGLYMFLNLMTSAQYVGLFGEISAFIISLVPALITSIVITGLYFSILGLIVSFVIAIFTKSLRRYKHKLQSTNYKPIYEVRY